MRIAQWKTTMSTKKTAILALACSVFLAMPKDSVSISGGSGVDTCGYPGIAAVVDPATSTVLCTGVIVSGGTLLLPELCAGAMLALLNSDLWIMYGDGDQSIVLTKGTNVGDNIVDGVLQVSCPETPSYTTCSESATIATSADDIVTSSCVVVGFGSDTMTAQGYSSSSCSAASITKSTSSGCCEVLLPSMSEQEDWIVDDSVTLNCMTAQGSTCSLADIGAPIYCDTTSGDKVVVGLAASASCVDGQSFLVHDLTSGSDLKFGVSGSGTATSTEDSSSGDTIPIDLEEEEQDSEEQDSEEDDCTEKIEACSTKDQIDATTDVAEICSLASEWRYCLEELMVPCGLSSDDFPTELAEAEAQNCAEESEEDDCTGKIEACSTKDQIDATTDVAEICSLASEWRLCLEELMEPCDFSSYDFPGDLDEAEATNECRPT